jgi:cytochrome c oxidase subunit II
MAATPESSSVSSPGPGWATPFPRDEKWFLWMIAASVVAMTAISALWVLLAHHNVPSTYRVTTPAAFASKVQAFVAKYKGADGRVYVPPGTDAYLMGARYRWYPELVLQKNVQYRIWISSIDVLHGLSIVGGTQDLNFEIAPGHETGLKLTPSTTGRFLIVCNEFCGLGHHLMTGRLDVEQPDVFKAHLATVAAGKPATGTKPTTVSPAAPSGARRLSADPNNALKFDQSSLKAKAGKVTIAMENPSLLQHNVAIKTTSGQVLGSGEIVGKGGISTVTATLRPGTYTFFCSVPGHEAAGMKGTLVVTP